MLDQILAALVPHLLELVALALTGLIAFAAQRFAAWTGIQIEARHREALHSAIMTGIRAALERGSTPDGAVASAVDYAREVGAPDAVSALKATAEGLAQLARAKLAEVLGGRR